MIRDNAKRIIAEIPKNIAIVAATKTRTVEEIKEAVVAGISIIGENYVKEAEEKYAKLKNKAQFHMIGHLQTNKVKNAIEIFDLIQTVDSFKLANEISKRCKAIGKTMPVLIEVNIAKEKQKTGVMPEDVMNLIKEIANLENIRIEGLMTMGPNLKDKGEMRPYFRQMKTLYDWIRRENIPNAKFKYISMGMSNDYKIAIQEGSNMVRLGGVVFGERKKNKI